MSSEGNRKNYNRLPPHEVEQSKQQKVNWGPIADGSGITHQVYLTSASAREGEYSLLDRRLGTTLGRLMSTEASAFITPQPPSRPPPSSSEAFYLYLYLGLGHPSPIPRTPEPCPILR